MPNYLDSSRCGKFTPSFNALECEFYCHAEDSQMNEDKSTCGFCKQPDKYHCIADITRPIPLSHSSIQEFLTCHYGYYLKKIMRIETRPAHLGTALKAGKLWDSILQKHLGNSEIKIVDVINELEIDLYTVAKVRALYHAYKELGIEVEEGGELQAKVDLKYDINLTLPFELIHQKILGLECGTGIHEFVVDDKIVDLHKRKEIKNSITLKISGFFDRKYTNYFVENKLSGRPEFYLDPFFISSQIGTYFLADPNLEYCIMEVVQMPQQKVLKGTTKRAEETPEQLYERVYGEILSRPSKYFIGYNRETKRYGKKYFRTEFDLEGIKQRYQQIILEILLAQWTGNFYKNEKVCNNILPGIECGMKKICENGNVSESIYKIRGK